VVVVVLEVVLEVVVCCAVARADSTVPPEPPPKPAPPPVPACRDATHRAIERAVADYCRAHPEKGVHGSCAEWLRAFRGCQHSEIERADPGWLIVIKLFACHDPVIAVVPDGKRWRVREVTMRSLMPPQPPPLELDPEPGAAPELRPNF
jgi:hypothetical protein